MSTVLIEDWKIILFGKYKCKTIDWIIENDMNYAKFLYEHPNLNMNENIRKLLENIFLDKNEIYLTFGKYKNKTLNWIKENDIKYIDYLKNNEYVKTKMTKLYEALD